MFTWSEFIGLPWRDRGRDFQGVDCWGLVRLAFAAGTGIDLPSHAEDYRSAADRAETQAILGREEGDWIEVAPRAAQPFDVALFRCGGRLHVALIVRPPLVLNIEAGKTSVIVPMRKVTGVLQGIYRHKQV